MNIFTNHVNVLVYPNFEFVKNIASNSTFRILLSTFCRRRTTHNIFLDDEDFDLKEVKKFFLNDIMTKGYTDRQEENMWFTKEIRPGYKIKNFALIGVDGNEEELTPEQASRIRQLKTSAMNDNAFIMTVIDTRINVIESIKNVASEFETNTYTCIHSRTTWEYDGLTMFSCFPA